MKKKLENNAVNPCGWHYEPLPSEILAIIAQESEKHDLSSLLSTCHFFSANNNLRRIRDTQPINKVVVGDNFTLVLLKNGSLYGIGQNNENQLGLPEKKIYPNFTKISIPNVDHTLRVQDVFAAGNNTFILLNNGTLYGCGCNGLNPMGLEPNTYYVSFHKITIPQMPEGTWIRKVFAQPFNAFILLSDGSLYACGSNCYGVLGVGDYINRSSYTKVIIPNLDKEVTVRDVITSENLTVIRLSNDTFYECGKNYNKCNTHFVKVTLPIDDDSITVRDIFPGYVHTFYLLSNGALYGREGNYSGQLGVNSTANRFEFIKITIPGLREGVSIRKIVTHTYHSFILLSDNSLYGAGNNQNGQLGLNEYCYLNFEKIKLPELGKDIIIQEVISGKINTFLLFSNGALYGCGDNYNSQLGFKARPRVSEFTCCISSLMLLEKQAYEAESEPVPTNGC